MSRAPGGIFTVRLSIASVSAIWQASRLVRVAPTARSSISSSSSLGGGSLSASSGATMTWQVEHAIRSEEHTSELQSLMRISYAVFCLKNKNTHKQHHI